MRIIRSAFVIGRRDFTATVLSKAFIFFLLGPLFPLVLGGVFAGIGTNVATRAERPVVAVVASPGASRGRPPPANNWPTPSATGRSLSSSLFLRSPTSPRSKSACSQAAARPFARCLAAASSART